MTPQHDDPWSYGPCSQPAALPVTDLAAPATVLVCAHCGYENRPDGWRCGWCLVDFRDLAPRRRTTDRPTA